MLKIKLLSQINDLTTDTVRFFTQVIIKK